MDLLEQREFGPYEIEALLGSGGMGTVYRARHKFLRRTCALKILPPQLALHGDFHERFLREAAVAASLRHPNIVAVHDFGEHDGIHFLVMDLVEGASLRSVLSKEGSLPLPRTIFLLDQLADALDYMHKNGIVYRDLKPTNVMIGKDDHLTVVDFGAARSMTSPRLTGAGLMVGTPEYLAPELLTGLDGGERADQYTLGVVAYEMLTGRVPFSAPSFTRLLYRVAHEPPPEPRQFSADIPSVISEVVMRQLEKMPEARFPSARAFVGALRDAATFIGMDVPRIGSRYDREPREGSPLVFKAPVIASAPGHAHKPAKRRKRSASQAPTQPLPTMRDESLTANADSDPVTPLVPPIAIEPVNASPVAEEGADPDAPRTTDPGLPLAPAAMSLAERRSAWSRFVNQVNWTAVGAGVMLLALLTFGVVRAQRTVSADAAASGRPGTAKPYPEDLAGTIFVPTENQALRPTWEIRDARSLRFSEVNGAYRIENLTASEQTILVRLGPQRYGDVVYEAEAKKIGGPEDSYFGIRFRSDENDSLFLVMNSTGAVGIQSRDSQESPGRATARRPLEWLLGPYTQTSLANVPVKFRAASNGGMITLSVNGLRAGEVSQSQVSGPRDGDVMFAIGPNLQLEVTGARIIAVR